jgi:hypothetical protein
MYGRLVRKVWYCASDTSYKQPTVQRHAPPCWDTTTTPTRKRELTILRPGIQPSESRCSNLEYLGSVAAQLQFGQHPGRS